MDILITPAATPVTEPTSSVTVEQLRLAQQQGRAVRAALHTVADRVQLRVVVRIAAPAFLQHDQVNGLRYASPVVATFATTELARRRAVHPHASPRGGDLAAAHPDGRSP